jgi:hypothetical protein
MFPTYHKYGRFLRHAQIKNADLMKAITAMQEDASRTQQEVLSMVEALSDASNSDRTSSVCHSQYLSQMLC